MATKVKTPVERSKLTDAQSKKLDAVVAGLAKSLKIKADDQKSLGRFADKYLRFKLNVRNTGPHSHGFTAPQRAAITTAVREAFNIKETPRKVAAPAAKATNSRKRGSTKRTTAQLAKEQQARAEAK